MEIILEWIDDVRGADSMSEVARRSGVPQPTLSRQINNRQLAFDVARDISRAYGRPVLADLVTLGYLTPKDAGINDIDRALSAVSDEQLVREIGRRLDIAPSSTLWDAPISEAVARAGSAVVHHPDFGRNAPDGPSDGDSDHLTREEAEALLNSEPYAAHNNTHSDEEAEADPTP